MVNWTEIHPDFDKIDYSNYPKTYQQQWEELGITYQETSEWIAVGFTPCYYFWKRRCFLIKEQLRDYPLSDDKLNGEWYNVGAWRRNLREREEANRANLVQKQQFFVGLINQVKTKEQVISLVKEKNKLESLIRQARRNLGGEDELIDKLLAVQKMLTRVRYLDPQATQTKKELAQESLNEFFSKKIVGSNLSWEDAEALCAAQEELMMNNSVNVSVNNNESIAGGSTGLTARFKRQLSLSTEAQGKAKSIKLDETLTEYQTEPMETVENKDWKNIHSSFAPQLIQSWLSLNFTSQESADWININHPAQHLQAIQEPAHYAWLRDTKQLTPEWVLNFGDGKALRREYQASQQQAQIIQKNQLKPPF